MDYGTHSRSCQPEWMPMVYQWAGRLQALLYPARCRLCQACTQGAAGLCSACLNDLPWLADACVQCARPLPGPDTGTLCGRCQQQAPAFDATTALFHYQPPVDHLIRRFKFASELALAPLFSDLLTNRIGSRACSLPGLILPVPLHISRLHERGFNQATQLARGLAGRLGIPLDCRLCRRRKKTASQSLLPMRERHRNLNRAFATTARVPMAHVAIIDDVMTSGHTAHALAEALKGAGAERVEVWVIARAGA